METITIKELRVGNFKGLSNLTINFNHKTRIDGANATGKTSVFDAFTWCLFGKDSTERKDFSVKRIDANGKEVQRMDHTVEVTLSVDGIDVKLSRTLREKWVKRRGDEHEEFAGHETLLHWNDVPCSATEYKAKVESICPESLFKMLTSTTAFNALPWQDRRKVLFEIAGDLSDKDVAGKNTEFVALLDEMAGKSLAEFRKELAAAKKRCKDEAAGIPPRIDELQRSMPEPVDETKARKELTKIDDEIAECDALATDRSKAMEKHIAEREKRANDIHQINILISERKAAISTELSDFINAEMAQYRDADKARNAKRDQAVECERMVSEVKARISAIDNKLETLRNEWREWSAKKLEFNPADQSCPVCKREYEGIDAKQAEMLERFNADKAARLSDIDRRGNDLKEAKEKFAFQMAEHEKELAGLKVELTEFDVEAQNRPVYNHGEMYATRLEHDEQLKAHADQKAAIEAELGELVAVDLSDINARRQAATRRRDELLELLQSNKRMLAAKDRIAELENQAKTLGAELAALERKEFIADRFTKARVDETQSRINGLFKHVTFKMYRDLINGGQEECCETLVNGVPFHDANNAGKINAGIDIINALSYFHGKAAPIFVDNAEAVNQLIDTPSQVIELVVSDSPTLNVN